MIPLPDQAALFDGAETVDRIPEGESTGNMEPKWDVSRCPAFRDGDDVEL